MGKGMLFASKGQPFEPKEERREEEVGGSLIANESESISGNGNKAEGEGVGGAPGDATSGTNLWKKK